jgi:hypothetical protein
VYIFYHLTPPVACSRLRGKRAREPLATVSSEVSAYWTLSLREGMNTLSSVLTWKDEDSLTPKAGEQWP